MHITLKKSDEIYEQRYKGLMRFVSRNVTENYPKFIQIFEYTGITFKLDNLKCSFI